MSSDDGDCAFTGFSIARDFTAPSFTSWRSSSLCRRLYAFASGGDICFTDFSFSQAGSRLAPGGSSLRFFRQSAPAIFDQGIPGNHLRGIQIANVLVDLGRLFLSLGLLATQTGQQVVDDLQPLLDKPFEALRVLRSKVTPESLVRCPVAKEIRRHLRAQRRAGHQLAQALFTLGAGQLVQLFLEQEILYVCPATVFCDVVKDAVDVGNKLLGSGAGHASFGLGLGDLLDRMLELMQRRARHVHRHIGHIYKGRALVRKPVDCLIAWVAVSLDTGTELAAQCLGNLGYSLLLSLRCWVQLDRGDLFTGSRLLIKVSLCIFADCSGLSCCSHWFSCGCRHCRCRGCSRFNSRFNTGRLLF